MRLKYAKQSYAMHIHRYWALHSACAHSKRILCGCDKELVVSMSPWSCRQPLCHPAPPCAPPPGPPCGTVLYRQQAMEENIVLDPETTTTILFGHQTSGNGTPGCNALDYHAGHFYLPVAGLYAINATLCFDSSATTETTPDGDSNVAITVAPVGGAGFQKRTTYARVPKSTATGASPQANFSVTIHVEIEAHCPCQMLRIEVTTLGSAGLALRGCKNLREKNLCTFASVRLLCHAPVCC
jgi:hypothetical protein